MSGQRGFALIEMTIAALIATLLAVWAMDSLVRSMRDASAEAHATWMLEARDAVAMYLERHGQAIRTASGSDALSAAGYVDWSAPAAAELKRDALLSGSFPESGPLGGGILVRVWRQGACPGVDCRVEALLHTDRQVLDRSGAVDEHSVARWLMASRGRGAAVHPATPDAIRGPSLALSNPVPGGAQLPVGTLAMAAGIGPAGDSDFLRVRDSRNPDFQGGLAVRDDISSGASISATTFLRVGSREASYLWCDHDGAVARSLTGSLVVCEDNTWLPVGRGGGGFSTNTRYGCRSNIGISTANPITGGCTCPIDHMPVKISDSGTDAAGEGRTVGYLCVG